jgi:hypothetical protein
VRDISGPVLDALDLGQLGTDPLSGPVPATAGEVVLTVADQRFQQQTIGWAAPQYRCPPDRLPRIVVGMFTPGMFTDDVSEAIGRLGNGNASDSVDIDPFRGIDFLAHSELRIPGPRIEPCQIHLLVARLRSGPDIRRVQSLLQRSKLEQLLARHIVDLRLRHNAQLGDGLGERPAVHLITP